jgi:hypothetical protein
MKKLYKEFQQDNAACPKEYRTNFVVYLFSHLMDIINSKICEQFDHKIVSESHVGPDSGSESHRCKRCGWSQDITYY